MEDNQRIRITPYSLKELANIYGVGRAVIKHWLRPFESELGPRQGRYYTVAQVKLIFDKIGVPEGLVLILLMTIFDK
jgi:hypothetical protein